MINEQSKQVLQNAIEKGFYEDGKATNIGERLALIHSEVSEALEADRKNRKADLEYFIKREKEIIDSYKGVMSSLDNTDFKNLFTQKIKDTFEDEMADVCIRVFDTCAFLKIDLEKHIELKMRFNSLREKMHGKATNVWNSPHNNATQYYNDLTLCLTTNGMIIRNGLRKSGRVSFRYAKHK